MSAYRIPLIVAALLSFPSAPSASPPARDAQAVPLGQVSSESCAECHEAIYRQWKRSMHAKSTAVSDPIFRAFYTQLVGDPLAEGVRTKKGGYPDCQKCHAPNAALEKKTDMDARPSFAEGVSCVTCHSFRAYRGTRAAKGVLLLGTDAYEMSPDTLFSATGVALAGPADVSHPYPLVGNPMLLKTNAACMGCHDKRDNAAGIPLCQTGDEMDAADANVACQTCHLPTVDGVADHSMLGGHDPDVVRRGLAMELTARRDGTKVRAEVTLLNLLPHKLPTGAPFRNVFVRVWAEDAAGKVRWQNFERHPWGEEAPEALLAYRLGNDAGEFVPPPVATRVLGDTRLAPHERRVIHYDLPAAGVARVRAEAYYQLLLPPFVKKLGAELPPELAAPKRIAMGVADL